MSIRAAILAGLLCIRLSACAVSAPVDGSDQLAKAEQLCRTAGDLTTEDPKPSLAEAESLLSKVLEKAPENADAARLLDQARLVRQAIEYVELRGYSESDRKTGIYFTNRFKKADEMLKSLPADSPFADLAALWRGRIHYWFGMEGKYESEFQLARGLFEPLKAKYPDHRIIRMYMGEKVPALTTYKLEIPEGAPEWAVKAREGLVRATDVFRWWVQNRQVENGEMGGTFGDDCEMLRGWPVALLAGDDEVVRAGWRRIARGVWESGNIYKGYMRNIGDVEHAAEDISDTQPAMIGLDYGNPVFVERCLMPMKQMRDVWTAVNPAGHLHFRSHVFSATEIRSQPGDDTDVCYSARAVQTGTWAAWYTRNPALIRLLADYARGWVAHLDRTEAGKPAGVIPGNIRFATDQTAEPWHQGYCAMDYEAMNLMYELIFAAYALTGDPEIEKGITEPLRYCTRELLKPDAQPGGPADWIMARVRPAAEKWRIFTGKNDFDPLLRRCGSQYMQWLLSENRSDKRLLVESCSDVIESTKNNLEMVTSEVLFTDRVTVEHPESVMSLYTGHVGLSTYFPIYAVSWEDIGRDIAALVCENRTDRMKLLAYNFAAKPRRVGIRFWRLAPGDYTWRLGVDSDGDDEIEPALKSGKLRVNERGERLSLSLPPRQVLVLEVRQSSARGSASGLPDIAVAADEVTVRRSVLSPDEADIVVPIHNLGPVRADNVTVNIKVEQGAVSRLITRKVSLPACSDLEPVSVTVRVKTPLPTGVSRLEVSASFIENEITKSNNACRVPVAIPVRATSPFGATTMDKVKCAFGLPLDSEPFKGKTHAEVAKLLDEMGIDAVCACPQDADLIRVLHLAGIKVYAEMGMFVGKRHWEAHPESRPINARGNPIGEPYPGYCGVCPNQEWLRKEILDKVAERFQTFDYDGLWLDFIRYPGRWEEKKPILEECCFCDVCLSKFANSRSISYPAKLKSTEDKAQWILAKHRQEWVRFKCDTITDFVRQIKKAMARENPRAILGIFNVPWRQDEFDGAIRDHLGQDVKALAGYVDVFSPMVYHRYCRRPMGWIAEYTDWLRDATGRPVWPIVQVCDEPKPVEMSADEVFETLRTGLDADGSSGVMPFTLKHAVDDPAKLDALRKAFDR